MCSYQTKELIKATVAICNLFSINYHKNKKKQSHQINVLLILNTCSIKTILIARVRSMFCQVPVHWMKKGGIERLFISFHFPVFLLVLFKNKLDM